MFCNNTSMQIIGHRGLMGEAPQNTLASFEKAIKAGLPTIEMDARQAITGKVILFHDWEISKVSRGTAQGPIRIYLFKKLREVDVHDGFEGGPYQIPTLEEVLDLVDKYAKKGKKTRVNIELKGFSSAKPVAKTVKRYLNKGWKSSDFIISSKRYRQIAYFKRLVPSVDTAMLINDLHWLRFLHSIKVTMEFAKILRVSAINPRDKLVSKELVDAAHKNGLKVNVYTIKTSEQYKKMKKLGVDGVIVNYLGLDK
jgi:glycerophosphoryl diester phosphodiesterase